MYWRRQLQSRHLGFLFALGAFATDQASKQLVLAWVAPEGPVEVTSFLNIVLRHNRGVSFGLFAGKLPWWTLALFACLLIAAMSVWLWRSRDGRTTAAFGLFIGGGLGNAIDRLGRGAVTDFIDLHVGGYYWPAFNLADVAVVSGAALLIWDALTRDTKRST